MRIGVLTPELPPKVGGVGTSVIRICKSLQELGHEVVLISALHEGGGELLPRVVELESSQLGLPIMSIGGMAAKGASIREDLKGQLRRVFIETAIEYLEAKNLDLFMTFTVGEHSFMGSCIASGLGIPHIANARGTDVGGVMFTPKGLHYIEHTLKRSSATVFVCSYLKELTETVFGKRDNFHLILNSCPQPPSEIYNNRERHRRSVREMHGLAPDDFVIGFCGTFREKKGCRFLGEAFQSVVERDKSVKLLIVGGARTHAEQKLAPHLFDGGLSKTNVRFAGMASERNFVYAQYCAMDVLVKPSIEDGLPNVILEAMSMGVPVIGTDVFKDVVAHEKTGFICKRYKVEELADLILFVKDNPELAARVVAAAKDNLQKNHATLTEAEKYIQLFRGAISQKEPALA